MSESHAERTVKAFRDGAFNIDGWVIMYPSSNEDGFLFLKRNPSSLSGWGGGSLKWCTVFDTWEEASEFAARIPYIMKQQSSHRRILKLKITHSVELCEELPIGVLDALAEL